jgi:hypothetical protein
VNSVLLFLKKIIQYCSKFAKSGSANPGRDSAPMPQTAAQMFGAVAAADPKASLSPEAQWQRVSTVIEQSIQRAHGIGEQQSAARQQLDAAEYTLHRLIEELNEVMTLPVKLPAHVEAAATRQQPVIVQALAA